jgi:predicted component of type VI protein secretion system
MLNTSSMASPFILRSDLCTTFAGHRIVPDRVTTVGRTGDIRVYPNFRWVSRNHMEIMVTRSGTIFIRDVSSCAGIYVNRERIETGCWTVIQSTDEIKLGGVLPIQVQTSLDGANDSSGAHMT